MAKADKPAIRPPNLPADHGIVSGLNAKVSSGREVIQRELETMTATPGVYRMITHDNEVL